MFAGYQSHCTVCQATWFGWSLSLVCHFYLVSIFNMNAFLFCLVCVLLLATFCEFQDKK